MDAYALFVGTQASLSGAPSLIAKLTYNSIRDLTAIALIAYQPNVLIVQIGKVSETSGYVEMPKV